MTTARAEYLFPLARACHIAPPVVSEMTVTDFGRLTLAIDVLNDGEGD